MAADLWERIRGINTSDAVSDWKISEHQIGAWIAALADGEVTRAQVEAKLEIPTTGGQATDLDFLINTYQGIAGSNQFGRREKFLQRVHLAALVGADDLTITKSQITSWLTTSAS